MVNMYEVIRCMKRGWVAMDKNGRWCWYKQKPYICGTVWVSSEHDWTDLSCIKIAPVDDWMHSLIKVTGEE